MPVPQIQPVCGHYAPYKKLIIYYYCYYTEKCIQRAFKNMHIHNCTANNHAVVICPDIAKVNHWIPTVGVVRNDS